MTPEELKHFETIVADMSTIAKKANPIFGFTKYLVWAISGLAGIIIGSGIWVYATNITLKQHTETMAAMQAEAKATAKEVNEWRRAKDEIDVKLADSIINVSDLLKLHMRYTDPKGPNVNVEELLKSIQAAPSAPIVASPDAPSAPSAPAVPAAPPGK